MPDNVAKFLDALALSLENGTFVKMTLGHYKGGREQLQKINIRLIETKKGTRLFVLYKYETRDTAKNYALDESRGIVSTLFEDGFCSGHLFTTENDFQLDIGKKGRSRLNVAKPTFKTPPSLGHDRKKTSLIDQNSSYLKLLGITDDLGRVRDREQNKWRQINRFVEILAGLVENSPLKDNKNLKIVDMGSGKGYLTFAVYDHFRNVRGVEITMTGVDTRRELIELCNGIADASQFDGLDFVVDNISEYDVGDVDILIALHACNTATDDAMFKGIAAEAGIIVAAPCCHQEIRPQIKPPPMFRDILKHGVLMERAAETLTDGIRSMLLEIEGYETKMIEFVPLEHTPKNNMIVAIRERERTARPELRNEIVELKRAFGIISQHLETLLLDEGRSGI
jgi:hypothetical protein